MFSFQMRKIHKRNSYIEKIITEEISKRNGMDVNVIEQFCDDFRSKKYTQEFFVGQLDCLMFYSNFAFFNQCYQLGCNYQNFHHIVKSFILFLEKVKMLMQMNSHQKIYMCCLLQKSNIQKFYLWARIITINELNILHEQNISNELSLVFQKKYTSTIVQKIQDVYLPKLNCFLPNVLCEIILSYVQDFRFKLSCILPENICENELNLILPLWESITQCKVENCDFWK